MFFYFFIGFVVLQRVTELIIAKRNEKESKSLGGYEIDRNGYIPIVIMHTLFFISFFAEYYLLHKVINAFSVYLLIIFILTQILRYWAIITLGKKWNTRIIIIPGAKLVKSGPYRIFKHPNYVAVITEIAIIPLIFSCYYTSIIFTIFNAVILTRRIKIENTALGELK